MSYMASLSSIGMPAVQSYGASQLPGAMSPYSLPMAAAAMPGPGTPAPSGMPFLSTPTQQGWGGLALGAANGIFNAYMGLKQYGLMKDQLAEGKKQFGLNYDAQMRLTNSQLADRQRTRLLDSPNAGHASVADYMAQYGVKPMGG